MKTAIRGTDIVLYSGTVTEIVHNVLIGQPATSQSENAALQTGLLRTFTLAIPKGDTHSWTNRIVGFFGSLFRTVGYPLEGIEENIPLCWHKQVNVRQIELSGKCTIYEKTGYTRRIIDNVYCFDERGTVPAQSIAQSKGALHVTIYADQCRSEAYVPKIGDIIAVGEQTFEFDISSQESTSQSMKAFRESGAVLGVISEIVTENYGPLPDYIITAR